MTALAVAGAGSQEAGPTSGELIASGLQGTIGSTIGPDGALYVPEGALGHITRVDPVTGDTSTFAAGLPPAPFGGAIDLTFVGDTAYVLVTLVEVSGIYRMDGADSFTVIANLGAFSAANLPPYPIDVPIGLQFAIEAVDDGFIVSDGHHNRVLHATLDGEVSELIAYGNVVPTGLALDGDTVYMSEIGPIPHVPSDGKVVTFDIDQPRTQTVASGVSLVVDVGFGPDGELYALSQGASPGEVPPATPAAPDSGELLRVKGDGTFEVLVSGLDLSTSLSFSGDAALIVTLNGEVWRVENVPGLAGGGAVVVSPPSAGDAGLVGSGSNDLKTLAVVAGATVILAGLAWRHRARRTSAAA